MKARITAVGQVDGDGVPHGWKFDCLGQVIGIQIKDGQIFYAGYSVAELREIAARREEWDPCPS